MVIILVLGLILFAASLVLVVHAVGVGGIRSTGRLEEIAGYGFASGEGLTADDARAFRRRVDALVGGLGAFANRRIDSEREAQLRRELYAAGLYTATPRRFLGYRLLLTIAVPGFWLWLAAIGRVQPATTVIVLALLAGISWVGPGFFVHRKATQRLDEMDYEMPEMVDLLVTAVEAGLGFSAALQLAVKNFGGPLGLEFRLALQEQNMGLTMNEALSNLLSRTDTPAVRSFVQAIVQGETLGVSIGKILRDLADEMRRRRRQAAEERAHKAGTKILFPLVLLIFPALFVVALGPVLIQFSHGLGNV